MIGNAGWRMAPSVGTEIASDKGESLCKKKMDRLLGVNDQATAC